MKIVRTVALALAAAGCGAGDADNVMAGGANALSPEQIDMVLGPELENAAENEVEAANQAEAPTAVDTAQPERAAEPTAPAAAEDEDEDEPEPEPEPQPEPGADDEPANQAADNSSAGE